MSSPEEHLEALGRFIAVADEERRRFERALHGGVQQDLIAVSVQLQLARQLLGGGSADADALLEEIARDVQAALEHLRRVADEIYPSVLDLLGLVEAVRAAAFTAGLRVTIAAEGSDRRDRRADVAVYFCCRAAFRAVAHSSGTKAEVRLTATRDELRLALTAPAGVDSDALLAATRDRVEALGGSLVVEDVGGLRLAARVPSGQPRSAR